MNRKQYLAIMLAASFLMMACKRTQQTRPVRKDITEMVFASGELLPENGYQLSAASEGYLVKVHFKEGDTVVPGFMMARIDDRQAVVNARSAAGLLDIAMSNISPDAPALQQALLEAQSARRKMEQDSLQAARYARLYRSNSVARAEYENAQLTYNTSINKLHARQENWKKLEREAKERLVTSRSQYNINAIIHNDAGISPIAAGKVYEKRKQAGDYVKKGEVIAVMGDTGHLYARLHIDENSIAKVRPGQPVLIRLNTHRSLIYRARIRAVLPAFDVTNQSFYAEASFTGVMDVRISGTQLQANIITGAKKNALLIPRTYLRYGDKVVVRNGRSEDTVKVTTGIVSADWVEITGGLDENTTIIADK